MSVNHVNSELGKAKHFPGVWDEVSFFAEMEKKCGPAQKEIAKKIYRWADESLSEIHWGQGKARRDATFYAKLRIGRRRVTLFGIETRDSGFVFLRLENIVKEAPFRDQQKGLDLLKRVQAVVRAPLPSRYDFLGIRLQTFKSDNILEEFIQLLAWIAREIRTA